MSFGNAVRELNRKAGQGSFPVWNRHRPLLSNVPEGQIQPFGLSSGRKQLEYRFIVWEGALVLEDFPQRAIERLYSIGSVNHPPNI